MDYFSVDFQPGQKLGIAVVSRSAEEPNIGNTLVENVTDIDG